ncbi:SymE family type I addiction module toxin [Sporomusa aerivorans]|uniref:SymE family type I addiction module toxin n=1 Tax=Sporomusa aerivorans TaxID=204936 RepID=UPI00352B6E3F
MINTEGIGGKDYIPYARILTVYYTHLNHGKDRWPLIRLQGKWLQDLGFLSGAKIAIEEHDGALLIKALPDDKKDKQCM